MNAHQSTIAAIFAAMFMASSGFADTLPDISELAGPPIERDTLKKDPESRCRKIWDQLNEGEQQPGYIFIVRDETGLHLA